MKKKFLKFTTALMAAIMVMASPITAKADEISDIQALFDNAPRAESVNGIAQAGVKYTLNTINDEYWTGDWVPTKTDIMFLNVDEAVVNQKCDNILAHYNKAGYEWKCVYIVHTDSLLNFAPFNSDVILSVPNAFGVSFDDDIYKIAENYELSISRTPNDSVLSYNFFVNYKGIDYTECKNVWFETNLGPDTNWTIRGYYVCLLLPEGYDDEASVYFVYSTNPEDAYDYSGNIRFSLSNSTANVIPVSPIPNDTATPAPEQPAAPTAPSHQGTVYTTKSGDTLSKIAKELYNDSKLWRSIYELNKDVIKNPNVIYSNMQLMLP